MLEAQGLVLELTRREKATVLLTLRGKSYIVAGCFALMSNDLLGTRQINSNRHNRPLIQNIGIFLTAQQSLLTQVIVRFWA
jgi:hypothetical protein